MKERRERDEGRGEWIIVAHTQNMTGKRRVRHLLMMAKARRYAIALGAY